VQKLRSKKNRWSLSFNVEFGLEIAEDVSEIYVEELAVLLDHHIAWVAISYAHNIGCHKVGCTGSEIVFLGEADIVFLFLFLFVLVVFFFIVSVFFLGVMLLKEKKSGLLVEGFYESGCEIFVNFRVVLGVNNLYETYIVASGEGAIDVHLQIEAALSP